MSAEDLDELIKSSKFQPKADFILLKLVPSCHRLSREEQQFFKKLTEAVFGFNEQIRNDALRIVSSGYDVSLIAPYLCNFIKETIHVNLVFAELTILIYTVRMTKSLLSNEYVCLKKYVHEVLPAILSCVLTRRLSKYYHDNHWTLRDFSACIIGKISQKYSNNLNNMRNRIIRLYEKTLKDPYKPLTSMYGAIVGLNVFGEEIVLKVLFPTIKFVSAKLQMILENHNFSYSMDMKKQQMIEAKHVRDAILNICAPILYKSRNANDGGICYVKEFGAMGQALYVQVKTLEKLEQAQIQTQLRQQQLNNFIYFRNNMFQ